MVWIGHCNGPRCSLVGEQTFSLFLGIDKRYLLCACASVYVCVCVLCTFTSREAYIQLKFSLMEV